MTTIDAQVKQEEQRDAILAAWITSIPYNQFIGVAFDRMGDELTARLPFQQDLIGNPFLPALHGGVIGAMLELTALTQLGWDSVWTILEAGGPEAARVTAGKFPAIPKTIDISVDYLRSGRPRDTFARARVHKAGRRVANVHVEAWQDSRDRPVAALRGNFLMPDDAETS